MGVVEGATRGKGKRRGRIINDLTPMVDIAFLLVIFFMTTTVFREPQAIEIALPPKGSVPTAQSNVISIFIDSIGVTSKQLSDEVRSQISLDSIEAYLKIEERNNVERQTGGKELLTQFDAMPEGEAKDSLDKYIRRKVSKLVVLVDVHGRSRYQDMVRVMDQVQQAGIVRFSIVPHIEQTPPPAKKGGRSR